MSFKCIWHSAVLFPCQFINKLKTCFCSQMIKSYCSMPASPIYILTSSVVLMHTVLLNSVVQKTLIRGNAQFLKNYCWISWFQPWQQDGLPSFGLKTLYIIYSLIVYPTPEIYIQGIKTVSNNILSFWYEYDSSWHWFEPFIFRIMSVKCWMQWFI